MDCEPSPKPSGHDAKIFCRWKRKDAKDSAAAEGEKEERYIKVLDKVMTGWMIYWFDSRILFW